MTVPFILILLTLVSAIVWFWSQAAIHQWMLNHARNEAPHHGRFWLMGGFTLISSVLKYPGLRRKRGESATLAWVHWIGLLATCLFLGLTMGSIRMP